MKKVLVIDDSLITRRVAARDLQAAGFEVLVAENGKMGLELIESDAPDCVILDLLMPVMTGFQVLEALSEKGSSVPVIVASADIQETTRQKVVALGAKNLLNKPVKSDQLVSAVQAVLGISDQEAA